MRYLTATDGIWLHDEIMARTGAAPAPVRDMGALESAILRSQTTAHCEQADLVRQSVLLTVGISQAQAFVDGNKRAAFVGDDLALARQLEAIAERQGSLEEATLAFEAWLRNHVELKSE